MIRFRVFQTLALSILFVISHTVWAVGNDNMIKVMSYNLYIGADLKPILESPTRNDFNDELVAALQGMAANKFKDRVQRQAAIIVRERPDVIALQEVWQFQCKDAFATLPKQGCSNPTIAAAFGDFLEELLAALNAQGVKYRAISKVKNLDLGVIKDAGYPPGIPFDIGGSVALLNGADRGVILVRSDLPSRAVNFERACPNRTSVNGCTYDLLLTTPTPVGSLTIPHGFAGVDVKVGKKNYRIVNTHLEQRDPFPFIQADQADELIKTVKRVTPVNKILLVMGDMNSTPNETELPGMTPAYQQFLDAGFTDTWLRRRSHLSGNTCCQAENLTNNTSRLNTRIDFIFSHRDVRSANIHLVGIKQADKTVKSRLWPSDHAGLVAELHF